jgi:hypothetical protein
MQTIGLQTGAIGNEMQTDRFCGYIMFKCLCLARVSRALLLEVVVQSYELTNKTSAVAASELSRRDSDRVNPICLSKELKVKLWNK